MNPLFDMLNATPNRVPMGDWFWTHDATKSGFQARSVVGGVYLRLLYDDGVWRRWSKAGGSGKASAGGSDQ